jgi:hypothetical protein
MFVEMLGNPPKTLVDRAKRKKFFEDNCQLKQLNSGKSYKPNIKSIKSTLMCKDKQFVDMIERCLDWDPKRRMMAS